MHILLKSGLIKKSLISTVLFLAIAVQAQANEVKITEDMPYLDVQHNGETVRIERIQDQKHKLTNSFAKTSRVCPPFCVHPIELGNGINTVGEIEVLKFLDDQVKNNKGLLVDARMPQWHEKGTIPGSVNIPFTILAKGIENSHTQKILKLLGAKEKEGKWEFKDTRELILYCNGMWCGQSPLAIKNLTKIGYPAEKLKWYRGGMQAWQLLGLTTVSP
jgi:rhodanese-related sulfurtransferase